MIARVVAGACIEERLDETDALDQRALGRVARDERVLAGLELLEGLTCHTVDNVRDRTEI